MVALLTVSLRLAFKAIINLYPEYANRNERFSSLVAKTERF